MWKACGSIPASPDLLHAESDSLVVHLAVDEALPRATVDVRVPVQAVVDGDGYDGGLILSVDNGRLSALEYWWVTEDRPGESSRRVGHGCVVVQPTR
jgi:hypothetical protein